MIAYALIDGEFMGFGLTDVLQTIVDDYQGTSVEVIEIVEGDDITVRNIVDYLTLSLTDPVNIDDYAINEYSMLLDCTITDVIATLKERSA